MRRMHVLFLTAAAMFAIGASASAKMPFVKKAQGLGFKNIETEVFSVER